MITEVHQGSVGDTGDYVELQAFSPGQGYIAGHNIRSYDGGNNTFSTFQFTANFSNARQATILVSHDPMPGADVVSADLRVVNTNGAVCFLDTTAPLGGIDCVDWGTPMGGPALPSPAGSISFGLSRMSGVIPNWVTAASEASRIVL